MHQIIALSLVSVQCVVVCGVCGGCVECVSQQLIITFHGVVISAPNYCLVTGKCAMCRGVWGVGCGVWWVGCVGCES